MISCCLALFVYPDLTLPILLQLSMKGNFPVERSGLVAPLQLDFHRERDNDTSSTEFDSNWVDCHVRSRVYLLFTCQVASFLAPSLQFPRQSMDKEVQAIQALRKTGLTVSKQAYQGGRTEVATRAWVYGRSGGVQMVLVSSHGRGIESERMMLSKRNHQSSSTL